MALTDATRLRELLGEDIPTGGSADDTLFTDERIEDFLLDAGGDVERAAYIGWRAKAAKLATLVDTTEGNSQKKFSQMHEKSLEMIKLYSRISTGPTEGRARVGQIRRAEIPWSQQ